MNRLTVLFYTLIFVITLTVSAPPASAEQRADLSVNALVKGNSAFAEVNEEGTEAAAATAVGMAAESVCMDPIFRADRPFIFIIREDSTGSPQRNIR